MCEAVIILDCLHLILMQSKLLIYSAKGSSLTAYEKAF
jgi:hypothetical protein